MLRPGQAGPCLRLGQCLRISLTVSTEYWCVTDRHLATALYIGHSNYQIGPNWGKSDQIGDTQYQIGAIL